ncbi:Lmo2079 family surface lipoprotein [Listeria fleischmannii]|uniref:Lipoprotein n=1 Tax=Listeria fleischmannii TaxID=1069827 RepID=A0A841YGG2_9LIST|nr:hypothetical protein [Listeria fleischmannii]MBC1399313.1 hypothetical protein [Listeria fleischmannii]MBC1427753.1 hypothetical protein [Listeria fleischmannii]STY35761.1 Uncharacterised protein [Listeria fleischmannii subsp. coloradonensis]
MKKGLWLVGLLMVLLVLTACGETSQEKFSNTFSKALDVPNQYTQKMSFKVDELQSDDMTSSDASSIQMLKNMELSVTTSVDKKAEKSYAQFDLASDGALNFNLNINVLMNNKTGEAYIPLDTIVNPDPNLKMLVDQATNGIFSKINESYPDLKNKYVSTTELSKSLGESNDASAKSSESAAKATENLQARINKMFTDYLNDMDENRFSEDDKGNITTTLTKKDFVNLAKDFEKALGESDVKADIKTLVESQGEVSSFDSEYKKLRINVADAIQDMEKNKTTKLNAKMVLKPGKNDTFEKMTMKVTAEDTASKTKLGGTFQFENVAFQKIPAFPKKDEIVSTEELQEIIQSVMMESIYGDMDFSDTASDF